MTDIDYFKSKSGKLSPNWAQKLSKHPEKFDRSGYNPEYSDKTVLLLMIKGWARLNECPTCGTEVDIPKIYCNTKCMANDPDLQKTKVNNTDIESKNRNIKNALSGRNDYHAKCWNTRKINHGPSGYSESGLEKIKAFDRNVTQTKATCIDRYGVSNISKYAPMKEKLGLLQKEMQTSRRHIKSWVFNKDEFQVKWETLSLEDIVKQSNATKSYIMAKSIEYNLRDKFKSQPEKDLCKFLDSLGVEYECNTRNVIPPLELDIYIPMYNLAIEYNGLYWHSSGCVSDDNIKNYHLNKTIECESKGIQLLHIFENEWVNIDKQNIWKSVIRNKVQRSAKIYARKCTLSRISASEAYEFCNINHLQGGIYGSEYYGLFHNNLLVQVAIYGKSRYSRSTNKELLRLCSLLNHTVVGGASKLFKGHSFVSYANRRWSMGGVYSKCNLTQVGTTPPCYFYVDNLTLKHRSSYMKHKLPHLLSRYDPNKTEVQNCYDNGLRRIWDCGNLTYVK